MAAYIANTFARDMKKIKIESKNYMLKHKMNSNNYSTI